MDLISSKLPPLQLSRTNKCHLGPNKMLLVLGLFTTRGSAIGLTYGRQSCCNSIDWIAVCKQFCGGFRTLVTHSSAGDTPILDGAESLFDNVIC
jgi:hypothetical protein